MRGVLHSEAEQEGNKDYVCVNETARVNSLVFANARNGLIVHSIRRLMFFVHGASFPAIRPDHLAGAGKPLSSRFRDYAKPLGAAPSK